MTDCSKQSDFDAQSYVKSSLDAVYHGTYADYANLMEISEEDAKKQMEEDFNESIRQQLVEKLPEAEHAGHPVEEETAGTIPVSHPHMKRRKVPDSHPITGLAQN